MNPQNTRTLILFLLPALVAAILFWPVISFEMVWDDSEWLERILRHNGNFRDWLQHAFSTRTLGAYYRPLAFATFYLPAGTTTQATFWHLTNYCLYLANLIIAALVFYVLKIKLAPHSGSLKQTGLFSGTCLLLFMALHPTQVETIAWISCRFDLMSSLFLLLIILLALSNLPRTQRYSAQAMLFFLALLSKETAIVFLGIYPLLMYTIKNDGRTGLLQLIKQEAIPLALMLVATALYLVLWYQNAYFGGFSHRVKLNPLYTDFASHLRLILATLGYSLRMLVYPFIRLSPVQHHEGNIDPADPYLWLGVAIIALGLLAAFTRKKYLPVITIILMGISPFLNWKQISFMGDIFQNRYLYLPILTGGIAFYAYLLKNPLPERLLLYRAIPVCYLAFMIFIVVSIIPLWKNNLSLWSWAVAENPRSSDARNHLANELLLYNQTDAALEQIEASLGIRDNFHAYVNLSNIVWNKGDHERGNDLAFLAMQQEAYQEDHLKLVMIMAHKNLQAGNIDKAQWWLNSIPAEFFNNPIYHAEYSSLQEKLLAAKNISP